MSNITRDLLFRVDSRNITKHFSSLVISSNEFNDPLISTFDLNGFVGLKSIIIGDECFRYVRTFSISNMILLESMTIGENSFTNFKNNHSIDLTRSFLISNCPRFISLTIGSHSFSDYSSFSLSRTIYWHNWFYLPLLNNLIFGELTEISYSFYNSNLQLTGNGWVVIVIRSSCSFLHSICRECICIFSNDISK